MSEILVVFVFTLFFFFSTGTEAKPPSKIESDIVSDLLMNAGEVVNIKSSNSHGCADPCTVEKYIKAHLSNILKDLSEAKSADKTQGEPAKVPKDKPTTSWTGECSSRRIPHAEDLIEAAKITLPQPNKRTTCSFHFGFKFGEIHYSENLSYIKIKATGVVLPGSFVAVGTP